MSSYKSLRIPAGARESFSNLDRTCPVTVKNGPDKAMRTQSKLFPCFCGVVALGLSGCISINGQTMNKNSGQWERLRDDEHPNTTASSLYALIVPGQEQSTPASE